MVEGLSPVIRRKRYSLNTPYTFMHSTQHPRLTLRTGTVVVGDYGGEGTPGSISNPAVKLTRADGTWGVTPWESKSSPTPPPLSSVALYGTHSCVADCLSPSLLMKIVWSPLREAILDHVQPGVYWTMACKVVFSCIARQECRQKEA